MLLLGIDVLFNYGLAYCEWFKVIYVDLFKQYKIVLVPFFLEKVVLQLGLM